MRLTQRLSIVWIASVFSAVMIAIAGVAWSWHWQEQQRRHSSIKEISEQVALVLAQSKTPSAQWKIIPEWLRINLKLLHVEHFTVRYQGHLIIAVNAPVPARANALKMTSKTHKTGAMVTKVAFSETNAVSHLSWHSALALVIAFTLVILTAWWGGRWQRKRLKEVDNISHRAQRLIKGELIASGDDVERPRIIRQALDYLVHELQDARKERSRFDAFMRSNTFLDPVTGLGNRLYFDNQIESAIRDEQGGYLLLLQFRSYDELSQQLSKQDCEEFLKQIALVLHNVFDEHEGNFMARRNDADFTVLLPSTSLEDTKRSVKSLLLFLKHIQLPTEIDKEHAYHVGIADIASTNEPYQLMAEADMALRAAQVQEVNTWFMYQRDDLPRTEIKGSVRWRTLLEEAIRRKAFVLSSQPVVTAADMDIHHYEMLLRLRDESGNLMPAHVFLPMAKKCGMSSQIDRVALHQLLKLMRYEARQPVRCSINLSIEALIDSRFEHWLELTLMQYRDVVRYLIIEVSEYQLTQHLDAVGPILAQLKSLGCTLAVDQVGQNVVSTHYAQDLNIDYLKLHANVIRNIDERSENQLFVRSILGACDNTSTQIFALAVERQEEWRTLKSLGIYGGQGHLFSETSRHSPAFLG
ncbi:EAL domain-containing protein [Echinimonas agarilytica]|uniref:EAL domain-containing protein n=1 Tax=Echinimonas agarilytica TaxID=1215918 RepID=A0AA41W493_9GAMM|nr:EAL domain-containing protein [Echinimonas agarilytica]MCM2678574.1 EAL domain-containing protein [Echinimonas agarilytica]